MLAEDASQPAPAENTDGPGAAAAYHRRAAPHPFGNPDGPCQPPGTLLASTLLALLSTTAQAQQVVLKVHHFLPSTGSSQVHLIGPWCDKINKEAKDRLKCQIYPSMQ